MEKGISEPRDQSSICAKFLVHWIH